MATYLIKIFIRGFNCGQGSICAFSEEEMHKQLRHMDVPFHDRLTIEQLGDGHITCLIYDSNSLNK